MLRRLPPPSPLADAFCLSSAGHASNQLPRPHPQAEALEDEMQDISLWRSEAEPTINSLSNAITALQEALAETICKRTPPPISNALRLWACLF
jgi:hypothetical protein